MKRLMLLLAFASAPGAAVAQTVVCQPSGPTSAICSDGTVVQQSGGSTLYHPPSGLGGPAPVPTPLAPRMPYAWDAYGRPVYR